MTPREDARRGIALPMTLLVLLALALLASLALSDALTASRGAELAADAVRARAAAHRGLATVRLPPDLTGLCLQPPAAEMVREVTFTDGTSARLSWRLLARGRVQAEVAGTGVQGARHRLLVRLRPDSVPLDPWIPGCPAATRLEWEGADPWIRHPGG